MILWHSRKSRPVSKYPNQGGCFGSLAPLIFSGVFVILGLALFTGLTLIPIYNWWSAQHWEAVECDILSSEVRVHRGSDSTTYSVAITYEYTYPPGPQGLRYVSEQVDFSSGSSSGRRAKDEIVAQYPEGSTATAYVNPEAPDIAVLIRDFQLSYLFGMFGLIFAVVGVGVFFFGRSGLRSQALSASGQSASAVPEYNRQSISLQPAKGRIKTFAFVLIFALIWNGVILVIGWSQWRETGGPEVSLFLFLSIFFLIGLGLMAYAIYCFLALFNPHPHVTLKPGVIPLGQAATLTWRFDRSVDRIQHLKLYLIGTESATYQQGKETRTSENEFEKILIFETHQRTEMARGEIQVAVPEFTMHSFKAPNNAIKWTLQFQGEIAFWPDIADSFELEVAPMELAQGAT